MRILKNFHWVHYIGNTSYFDNDKVGKWMYFFKDIDYAARMCEKAVKKGIVEQAKHSLDRSGVACFYLNSDDTEGHKRVLKFFMENNLIPKNNDGSFKNILFKLDSQTRAGIYGKNFKSDIKLSNFVILKTGEFKGEPIIKGFEWTCCMCETKILVPYKSPDTMSSYASAVCPNCFPKFERCEQTGSEYVIESEVKGINCNCYQDIDGIIFECPVIK